MTRQISRWTRLIQPQAPETGFRSLVEPVTRGSTVIFDSVEAWRQRDWRDKSRYSYGLQATPITRRLEQQLAGIDEVPHALLYPSGLNAICMAMMALLKSGEQLLMPRNVYAPALEMASFMAIRLNIEFATYDPHDLSTLTITDRTRMVWVETPGSITMEVADLPKIVSLAHAKRALVIVDATWAAGISLAVFKLGVDVCIQALTKYQSGGSDVMMGSVTTASDEIYDKLFETRTLFGVGVSPEDCYLILRNLPHLKLRYLAQDQSARKVAQWFSEKNYVAKVLHPAFEDCPGHAVWSRDFSAAASLFSIVLDASITQDAVDRAIDSFKLFKIGVSWGGAVSLALPFTKKQLPPHYAYPGCLVRFYIGLEDTTDLLHDIANAFAEIDN